MLGLLIPLGGGDPIPLRKPNLVVGRRPSCDIRLDFANVSSHHCRLEYINGYWRAADLSRNGTKVNGERIDEKFLQPGDTIGFARHYYEIQYTPEPDAVAPVEDVDPFAMSLLEKAGLEHSNDRREKSSPRKSSTPTPLNGVKQVQPRPITRQKIDDDEDDIAMGWLNG